MEHKLSEIFSKVKIFIRDNDLLKNNKSIIVGFSGGADSVCLLFILNYLKINDSDFKEINLRAVHLHHGIRGAEADRDVAFVKDFCTKNNIELSSHRRDIPKEAGLSGESIEEAGRRIRYQIFEEEAKKLNDALIATAHHKNDSVETILFNMARGSGIAGMTGIRPIQGNIIRPLLCLTRKEIEDFNRQNDLSYVNDSTNEDSSYTRNYIRNEIVPLFENKINKNFTEHVCSLSHILQKANDMTDSLANELLKKAEIKNEGVSLPLDIFYDIPDLIAETLLIKAFYIASGNKRDVSFERIEALKKLIRGESHGLIQLPKGIVAEIKNKKVLLKKEIKKEKKEPLFKDDEEIYFFTEEIKKELEKGKEQSIAFKDIRLKLILTENFIKNDNGDYTKYFDYDKINCNVCLRKRRTGDIIQISADGKKKKLKKEFTDRKIPEEKRDDYIIFAEGSNCLWAVGLRQSAAVWADKRNAFGNNKKILRITVETET